MALKRHDKFHREIVKEIHEEEKIDKRVVDLVATSPFLFTSRKMKDKEDYTPIMHRYFGKIAMMIGRKKK